MLGAILRDTTTTPPAADSHLVFLPDTVYPMLSRRLCEAKREELDGVAEYLAERASDELLRAVEARDPTLLDRALSLVPYPQESDAAPRLAARLASIAGQELLGEGRRDTIRRTLLDSVDESGWAGFLEVDGLGAALPGFIEEWLRGQCDDGFSCIEKLYDWCAQDLSEAAHIDSAHDVLQTQQQRLAGALESLALGSDANVQALQKVADLWGSAVEDKREDVENRQRDRWYDSYDDWRDRGGRFEHEDSRFADVDE